MSTESMAWLGMALWLTGMGYSPEQAALCAGPLLEAFEAGFWKATT